MAGIILRIVITILHHQLTGWGGEEVAGQGYIGEKLIQDGKTDYVGEWEYVRNGVTPGGREYSEYRRLVKTYAYYSEHQVTPYHDSVWRLTTGATSSLIGGTIGAALGSVIPGAGTVVGVVAGGAAGGIIAYFVCESISPAVTREVWGPAIGYVEKDVSWSYAINLVYKE